MAQGLRLELRQSQQLVMTPQLQQAIRLLQMSNLELAAFVEREIEENPLIAMAGPAAPTLPAEPPAPAPRATDGPPGDDPGRAAEPFDTGTENLFEPEPGPAPRAGWDDALPSHPAGGRRGSGPDSDAPAHWPETAAGITLREHLVAQIGQMRAWPAARALAIHLVGLLDDDGYLREDTDELAVQLGASPALMQAALALVQGCEPTGVGARSLAECLALQLAERDRLDPAMRRLVDNLHLLGRGEHRRLRGLCGVDAEDYDDMLAELRALDPRPCAAFGPSTAATAATVVPDVLMRRMPDGAWQIELNPDTLPRVLIDRRYAARVGRGGAEVETWLAERRAQANWLIRSLDQRARTIMTIATEIVRQQGAFFEIGIAGLRPLTLRMVAEATGLHESTASRVTANKYIATPRGIFELKFFFTNALGGSAGGEDGVAAEAVRHRIRALVDAEAPNAILSDDAIVEMLRAEGIDIARRTVAKYRTALRIPSSVDRRRIKGGRG
ncbi:RNA polymerase factor sigma-54 [Limibaculum sp. FT325]|uniref:RNA polymerase factor sigma-54 n=1 Tax=Thermohalobaculum sediminis TaxID=2939436 RepID=UPI0020BE2E70|nr:RNA polymerase factor sigma-54 [Limibaculum sediminis]MCL5776679.1 RNA polymerase factor sigma-54 [Limibaculum sediminis]